MKRNIILTIAIPTYNRCDILDETLQILTSDSSFDDRVEIVISDNYSTDKTEAVALKYVDLFPNVRFYKNDKNIVDANFSKVLSYGRGVYLKLLNDTHRFNPGMLNFILNVIEDKMKVENKEPLFFYQNFAEYSDTEISLTSMDECVKAISFSVTSIANFGMWKDDFDKLEDVDRCATLQFAQVDWTFRFLSINVPKTFIFGNFTSYFLAPKKGGYNIFEIFIVKYLSLYDNYLESKKIRRITFLKEKNKLYVKYIFIWLIKLKITHTKDYTFTSRKVWKILLKYYWYYPFMYFSILLLIVLRFFKAIHLLPITQRIFTLFLKHLKKLYK